MNQREFNATRDGQMAMCHEASKRATVFVINAKVRSLGGAAWHDSMIAEANEALLDTIREDLRQEFNTLVAKP